MSQPSALANDPFETKPLLDKRVALLSPSPGATAALHGALKIAGCANVDVFESSSVSKSDLHEYDMVLEIAAKGVSKPQERRQQVRYTSADIQGPSPALRHVLERLSHIAQLDSSVIITGETGVGKEVFAQALHSLSARAPGPFVAVNVAAIPETLLEAELFGYAPGSFTGARKEGHPGKFVLADGGTLLLDEVGDLPLPLQAKLLRVLQERQVDPVGSARPVPFDVRVMAATHRNLSEMVREGRFRADLYYRLQVLTLEIPPLRHRISDLDSLVNTFLNELSAQYDRPVPAVDPEARGRLWSYPWPGNVRELRNAMEYAFAFGSREGIIRPQHLPITVQMKIDPDMYSAYVKNTEKGQSPAPDQSRSEWDRIMLALEACKGNRTEAARLLGISRAGLYIKLKTYQIPANLHTNRGRKAGSL